MNPDNHYDCAPMISEPLPKQAELRKLAINQACFKVSSDLTAFPRVSGAVVAEQGIVEAEIQFSVDERHIPCIDGWVRCSTQMVCQRCLEPVAVEFSSTIALAAVKNDVQARELTKVRDPLLVEDDALVDLNEILEDELLLAMPFVSYHEPGQCKGKQTYQSFAGDAPVEEKKESPFSVLASLKSNK